MTGNHNMSKSIGGMSDARLSFDAAFIGGSLAVGAMLFVLLLTIKGLFPGVS
jgi:hypothetical protein